MPTKTIIGKEFIPSEVAKPKWEITVGGDSIVTDMMSASVKLSITDSVGSFNVTISNDNGKWTKKFAKGDIVNVYADYDDGTNQIFSGMLETIRYKLDQLQGFSVCLEGKDFGKDAVNIKITKRWDSPETISDVFEWLITNKLIGHSADFSDIATVTEQVQPNWNGRPIWNCFQDLALWAGGDYHFYCDKDKKWHFFKEGDKELTTDNITYGENLINMEVVDSIERDYANKVTIYGREIHGIPILVTASETSAPHSTYGSYEKIITNNNLINISQLNTEKTNQINVLSTVEDYGNCTTIGLPTAIPGYKIWIVNPYCNIMEQKIIKECTHHFRTTGFTSTIDFTTKEKGLVTVLADRYLAEQQRSNINNPFGMEFAYVGDFEDDNYGDEGTTPDSSAFLDTMSKTLVYDNALMLQLLQTNGNAVSKLHTANENITQCVPYVKGSNLESDEDESWVTILISVDNGVSWEEAALDTLHTVVGTGKWLKIKVIITSLTTKIKALGVLYK